MTAPLRGPVRFRQAYLNAGQTSYIVGLVLVDGRRVDIAYFPGTEEGYRSASITQDSINKHGKFVGENGTVQGKTFRSSEKFIEAHSGKLGDISIYGQESNYPRGVSPR